MRRNRVLAAEEEDHDPLAHAGGRIGRQVFQDVITDQFLDVPVLRIGFGDDVARVFLHQGLARGKHLRANQIEGRARQEPGQDAAGTRFVNRVRVDNYVAEFFRHKGD